MGKQHGVAVATPSDGRIPEVLAQMGIPDYSAGLHGPEVLSIMYPRKTRLDI